MATRKRQEAVTVYSTDDGRMCPTCGKPTTMCTCRRKKAVQPSHAPKSDGIVRVGRETAGRKGKGVTVITGVPLEPEALQKLAKQLKQQCGAGGAV
ncbi:stress response translation initiation inhibitor YciH, partial [Candidatus Entotheonella serta]